MQSYQMCTYSTVSQKTKHTGMGECIFFFFYDQIFNGLCNVALMSSLTMEAGGCVFWLCTLALQCFMLFLEVFFILIGVKGRFLRC